MGLFGNLVRAEYSLQDWFRDIRFWIGGRQTASGVTVNEQSALRYVTVYSCARVLAETLGSLPLVVYRERPGGGQDKARDHPVFELLHDQPNDEMSSSSFREAMQGQHVLAGNCYGIITPNRRGQPIDLYPVDWTLLTPERNQDTGRLQYRLNDRGKDEIFPPERVFHVPGWGFNGIQGYSTIAMARELVGLGLAITEFAARFYGQGMNVGGVLEHPEKLSNEAHQRLKASIEAEGAGLANSWRPLILEEGMKFARIPMPLRDAQFIEQQKLTDVQICGLFRVPPHMIANLERATFSNIEHQSLDFVKFTMLPYITRWEQVINRKLFTRQDRQQGYYARFNVEGLLRGDYKSRQEGLQIQRQNGVINTDEWRALEEMNPIGGVAGQAHLVNGNMISVETAAKQPPRQAARGGGEGGDAGDEG